MALRRRWAVVPILATLALALAGCGSDGGSGATSSSTGGSDYKIVSDGQVAAGLADIQTLGKGLATAAAGGDAAGKDAVEQLYARWYTFEGTVRKNNPDLYLQMEDGLSAMKLGVEEGKAKRITGGLAEFIAGAEAYQAAHP